MADKSVQVTNFPDSGSHERVALDLMKEVMYRDDTSSFKTKDAILTLYVDCWNATWGRVPKT